MATKERAPRSPTQASHRSGAEVAERGLQDRLEVAGVAVDLSDGDDHVEDILEREVVADFVEAVRGNKERSAGGEQAVAIFAEERASVVGVFEQLGADVTLALKNAKNLG